MIFFSTLSIEGKSCVCAEWEPMELKKTVKKGFVVFVEYEMTEGPVQIVSFKTSKGRVRKIILPISPISCGYTFELKKTYDVSFYRKWLFGKKYSDSCFYIKEL